MNELINRDTGDNQTAAHQQPAPDDHFEKQAQATISQWAALRRELFAAQNRIEHMGNDAATMRARIEELTRANQQLHEQIQDSQKREGEAKEQAGWLRGIMATAAGALTEGLGQRQRSAVAEEPRDAPVRRFERLASRS